MKIFQNCQRVRVMSGVRALIGKTGRIERLGVADSGAWVTMDEPLSEEIASFPVGDTHRNSIFLYPEECEPAGA
jgi:hypothetical protein